MNPQPVPPGALYMLVPAPQAAPEPTKEPARDPLAALDVVELYGAPFVRLSRWCSLTDDTPDAVHARRKAGKWVDGKHCHITDGKLWVNLKEAAAWIAGR